jgi:radical SAM protein with 4Fe4S-binding SPASM domain
LETEKYTDWSQGIQDQVLARRIPISGSIELTQRCNLNCIHCYNNLSAGDEKARQCELTYEEHCRIIDQITEAGCLWSLFTGGEILLRKDFLDIYTYAKQKGLLITLFTNGTLLTPKIADYLVDWRPFSLEISLYGLTRETYERVTRVPGSYEQCMRGIRLLVERGLPLILKTMVLSVNQHELWDLKRFVEEELNLEFKYDAVLNPRIDCSKAPLSVRLSSQDIVALDLKDPKRIKEWRSFCEYFDGPFHKEHETDNLYHCGGGRSGFAIEPYGKLSLCLLWPGEGYDLRTGSFEQGWGNFLFDMSRQKITHKTKCMTCELRSMCDTCPATAELESGHAETPVDFLCELAHLRAYVLGLDVAPHGHCEYCKGGERYEEIMEKAKALLRESG